MANSGKEFITNLRNARMNPFANSSSPALITRHDVLERDRKEYEIDKAHEAAEKRYVDKLVKETDPLRDAIREVSGGKIIVDKSIYDKTKLERILDTVKNMQKLNNETLRPGYAVIKEGEHMDHNDLGTAAHSVVRQNRLLPFVQWQLPSDIYGSKNAPYRIELRNANDTIYNDWHAGESAKNNWTIEDSKGDTTKSAVHAHELAHTVYNDLLKKTQNPDLTISYTERVKRRNFRDSHASPQEIFDVAAKNTGYKSVKDAAASISEYARQNAEEDEEKGGFDASKAWSPNYRRLTEVFSEAYDDVLYNQDNASNYSKELMKLFSNYVNDYNNTFNETFVSETGMLPPNRSYDNKFNDNWRNAYSR